VAGIIQNGGGGGFHGGGGGFHGGGGGGFHAVAAFMAAVLAGLPDSTAATASVGASMAFATEITSGAFATEITSGGLVAGSESITDMATIRTMATTTPANILLPRCGTTAPTLRAITPTYRNATPAGSPSPVASRCPVAPASRVANSHVQPARPARNGQRPIAMDGLVTFRKPASLVQVPHRKA